MALAFAMHFSGPCLSIVNNVGKEAIFRYQSETCKDASSIAHGVLAGEGSGRKKAKKTFPTLEVQ